MDNVILLTSEQYDMLKYQIRYLLLRSGELSEEKKKYSDTHNVVGVSLESSEYNDYTLFNSVVNVGIQLDRAKKILERAHVLDKIDDTKINIGTKFIATTVFEDETLDEEFTLIQMRLGRENSSYVSLESIFGQSVYLKKVGDEFSYETPYGTMKGSIKSIIPNQKEVTKTR